MTKQEHIEEMVSILAASNNPFVDVPIEIMPKVAEALYNADYRKAGEVRKETAKEILQRVIKICKNEEDFQNGSTNTQLMPLYFGIANGCAYVRGEVKELAKQYGVEVKE